MQKSKSQKIITAVFIIGGLSIFMLSIFVIGSKQNMFSSTFKLNSVFANVGGLSEGSSVSFAGIKVGTVEKLRIKSGSEVLVEMSLDKKVYDFVKKDSKVSIISEGLVGNKIIEISAGTASAQSVQDGDMLESVKPVSMEDIMQNLKSITDNAIVISKDISSIMDKVDKGEGTMGQLINNSSLYDNIDSTFISIGRSSSNINKVVLSLSGTINAVTGSINSLTVDVKRVTDNLADITDKMNSSKSIVGTLLLDTVFANNLKEVIQNAQVTTKYLEQGALGLSENMEALKHNFLFKGYFEDIGYWEKDDVEYKLELRQKEMKLKMDELRILDKRLEDMKKTIEQKEKEVNQNK
jgi:phospholipid/cholesterol/gamma-HCH transport system substrate-binding protein